MRSTSQKFLIKIEDPDLLSQLSRIENGDMPDPGPAAGAHDDAEAMDVDEDSSNSKSRAQEYSDVINKIRQVEAAIKQDRDNAVQFKRAGKMEDARKALIQMKQRQKQLEDLKILAGDQHTAALPRPTVVQPSPVRQQVRPVMPESRSPSPSIAPTKTPPPKAASATAARPSPRTNPQAKLVHQRMLEYKQAILDAKDSGDVETAQKLFDYFRRLQQIQSDLAENVAVGPWSYLLCLEHLALVSHLPYPCVQIHRRFLPLLQLIHLSFLHLYTYLIKYLRMMKTIWMWCRQILIVMEAPPLPKQTAI
jgi:hypothetical protein